MYTWVASPGPCDRGGSARDAVTKAPGLCRLDDGRPMKSAPFEYHRPSSLDEVISLKGELGAEARILAGGQSLMPLMHFRLAMPGHLIDVNRIDELNRVGVSNGSLSVGATARQQTVLDSNMNANVFP